MNSATVGSSLVCVLSAGGGWVGVGKGGAGKGLGGRVSEKFRKLVGLWFRTQESQATSALHRFSILAPKNPAGTPHFLDEVPLKCLS